MPRWDYLFTQFRVIVTYLRLLAFPVNQNLDYDYPVFHSFFSGEVIASFLLLTVLLGVAVWLLNRTGRGCPPARKMWRLAAFGIFWFFITLTVESSVVPIIDVIFEHRLYLPAVGFCVVIPLMVLTYWPVRGAVLLACLVLVLGGATIRRNMVWGDDLRLWLDIAEKSPHKKRVFAGLGDAYKRKGQYDQSIGCYNQYLTFNPDGPSDFINRGTIHLSVGNLESALADFNRAIYLSPKSALAYLGRGRVFAKVNDYISAIKDYQSAIKIDAGLYQAHNNLGNAYDDTGLHDAAINEYGTAIALNPDFKEAYYNRAIAYSRKGMHTEAEKDLKSYKGN
jgi:regulator of sirC expression with transglutaminase-like and TPR domain